MADIRRALKNAAPINRDFSPVLYYYHLRYWMSQFKVRFGLFEAALLLLLAAYLVRIRPVPLAVFATGFAASSLEVVLLVGFQILCGSVYHQVGLVVTMFMLGLGVGALAMNRGLARRRRRDLMWLLGGLAVFAACLPAALMGLGHLGGWAWPAAAQAAIPLFTLLLAALVGMAFPLGRETRVGSAIRLPERRRRRFATLHGRLYRGRVGGTLGQHASDPVARCSCRMPPHRRPMRTLRWHPGRDGANAAHHAPHDGVGQCPCCRGDFSRPLRQ